MQANASHGLPLTADEKRAAVQRLLDDPEWRDWSDREIARRTGVSAPTVGRLRQALSNCNDVTVDPEKRRKCKVGGRVRSMRVGGIGLRLRKRSSGRSTTESNPDSGHVGSDAKNDVMQLVGQLWTLLSIPERSRELEALVSSQRRQIRQLAEVLLERTGMGSRSTAGVDVPGHYVAASTN
jgi:hypothetical protein